MKALNYKLSKECTLGVELELQMIHPHSYDLISRAKNIVKALCKGDCPGVIKPEITQSMIEINTSIHESAFSLLEELVVIRNFFTQQAQSMGIRFAGGGAHPFQKWQDRKIYPAPRYKRISKIYGYLAKQVTVFGQHIHIGCTSGDDAIYLTHVFARYLPHFIALSASSPFYQGVDTLFNSARVNVMSTFPTSGFIPYVKTWEEFCVYFAKMYKFNIVESMKDFYWDVRPKPEFGTVELRMCDTPLTIEKAAMLAAYAQTLAFYALQERPLKISENIYTFYNYNRFQAARFGFDGNFINSEDEEFYKIHTDILQTIEKIRPYVKALHVEKFIEQVAHCAVNKENDAKWLRETFAKTGSLAEVVREQSKLWMEN